MIAAKTELDRVTKRSATNDLDLNAVAESHFEQPSAKVVIAAHRNHASFAADPELIQTAGVGSTLASAGVIVTSLFHGKAPVILSTHKLPKYYIIENEFQLQIIGNGSVEVLISQ